MNTEFIISICWRKATTLGSSSTALSLDDEKKPIARKLVFSGPFIAHLQDEQVQPAMGD